ncbi:splicing factor 3B subunit 4 [Verticillium alfalfae VaMs.102]|uniref:Splicing factor 3B subunit 4 n=1 Tax=Verticillium alfalfae (strain VaMs.102 / ATCC MYA-4576 / FGSC 10136) TaxID=526221 RepID=C9S914_VERA1|nr:splicing factor 3B subunit 4 [Verticillium alfalfae VaMs.102]EEY14062.1 splicing factor 3B subunit 4 [Verticillium alfalfae VaMs.102]
MHDGALSVCLSVCLLDPDGLFSIPEKPRHDRTNNSLPRRLRMGPRLEHPPKRATRLSICREQDKDATVYIGNIDERATSTMVYEIMLQMGPIHNIHMPRDRVTQTHQGFGFVEFRTPSDAEYAANVMNGVKLYGKSLRVNKASADKQKQAEVGAELFVGNLDPMVDEKILYDTFSRFGPLLTLPKVAREDSGNSKGFGFISFADFESSDAAVENLHGQYLLSKEVSVQYAFKKDGKGERHGDAAERNAALHVPRANDAMGHRTRWLPLMRKGAHGRSACQELDTMVCLSAPLVGD